MICDLLVQDLEAMKPLPKQRFKVTRLAKVKTDKYSFVQFENNKYSTAPQYNRCEMWLEISAEELRILNDKYEEVVVHKRRYGQMPEPVVDWIKYLTAINRKPNAFKYTQFFKELPVVWQEYFNRADYDDSKKMLSTLTPIILDGKLDEATVALEVHEIQNADEFLLIYRNLTESPPPSAVKTQNTPTQLPYKNDLSVYGSLIGGEN
ncbi:hypothetical protein P378_08730 [Desulforamulus profundi]|uniref:Transposase for insertion sequence element IS21-like C-terminal domain-containing protein n=1 Tax=Desulforamulus profundi TaxID=1383067 RepID=A0A2C6MBP7_9FIRM|nr:hypothetical protein P378_08730 [Desulforamulus profundi]